MDEIHVHKTKKSICAHFAESPCSYVYTLARDYDLKRLFIAVISFIVT